MKTTVVTAYDPNNSLVRIKVAFSPVTIKIDGNEVDIDAVSIQDEYGIQFENRFQRELDSFMDGMNNFDPSDNVEWNESYVEGRIVLFKRHVVEVIE